MKKWSKILVYISFVGIIYFLYKTDNLKIPIITNWFYAVLALLTLPVIFVLEGVRWKYILKAGGLNISLKDGMISHGINVFGAYLPGKVWYIMGKAAFISSRYDASSKDVLYFSTLSQVLALWTGTLVGLIALIQGRVEPYIMWSMLFIFVLSTIFLFWKTSHKILDYVVIKWLKRKSGLPFLSIRKSLIPSIIFIIYWTTISIGFYFLIRSLGYDIPITASTIFPLTSVIGVVSIIAPGGLVVREGLLAGYFLMFGLEFEDANIIAITSRLWFVIGEAITFISSLVLNRFKLL